MIELSVEKIEFDMEQCSLRILGRNIAEDKRKLIKMGQFHTIDIELGDVFTIRKEFWDDMFLDSLKDAIDPVKKAEVAAIVMQEGLAHLCLMKSALTVTKSRIERRIPKKKHINQGREKAIIQFMEDIYQAIKKHIDLSVVKVILIGR